MATASPDDEVQLSAFLKISPQHNEEGFWVSAEYHQLAERTYTWSFYMSLIGYIFYLRRLLMQSQTGFVLAVECFICVAWLAVVIRHFWLARLQRNQRIATTTSWLYLERLFWTVATAAVIAYIRLSVANKPPQVAASDLLFVPEEEPSLPTSARNLLYVSLSISALLHGMCFPLPFYPQLAFSSAYIIMLLRWHSASAIYMLGSSGPTSGLQATCQLINKIQYMFELTLFGVPMDFRYRASACAEHHIMVVVVFAIIVCSLIPVYVSYCLERYAKVQYIHRLSRSLAKPTLCNWLDALFLVCCFTTAWNYVVCYPHWLSGGKA